MRSRERYDKLTRDDLVTREDIAVIAGVAETTVQAWAQDSANNGFPDTIRLGNRQVVWHRWGAVYEWLCKTGRSECGLDDGMLDLRGVAAHFNVAAVTVKGWRSRADITGFPDPDLTLGRAMLWKIETLDAWERPTRRRKKAETSR